MERLVRGLLLVGSITAVVACGSTAQTTSVPSTAAATPRPSGPLPIRVGTAEAGPWTTTAFDPKLTFTVPSDGWLFFFQDDDDEMAVGKSGNIEVTAGRVPNVVDPVSHAPVAAPDDLVTWLAAHPDLDAGTPQDVTVGGIDGRSIEVTNGSADDVDVFAFPSGNLRVSGDTHAVFWVLPYDGADLVFTGLAPIGSFDGARPEIQSLIDSFEIEGA